jgi:hypothetical protein
MDATSFLRGLLYWNWAACQPGLYAGAVIGIVAFAVVQRIAVALFRRQRADGKIRRAIIAHYGERIDNFERREGRLQAAYNDLSIEQESLKQQHDASGEEAMTLGRNAELLRATVHKLARAVRVLGILSALHSSYERKLTLVTFCVALGRLEHAEGRPKSTQHLDELLKLHERLQLSTSTAFRLLVQNLPGSIDGLIRLVLPSQLEDVMDPSITRQLTGLGQDIEAHLSNLRAAAFDS